MKKSILFLGFGLFILLGHHFAAGGFVVAGETSSFTNGMLDFLIYKLDNGGMVRWRKNLGGAGNDFGRSVQQTADGGYIVAGFSDSYSHGSGDRDFLIYKLGADGGKRWRKNLGGTKDDHAYSIRQTTDGGYVVAGFSYSYARGPGDRDFLIYKLDVDGRKMWRKNLGGIETDVAWSIRQTADGGYVVAGETHSYTHGTGDRDVLIYKLNAGGGKEWRKNLGGAGNDYALSIRQTTDGGYIVAGSSDSYTHGGEDFLIYKLNAAGGKQWRKNLGGASGDHAQAIEQTADGGYVVAGYTYSYVHGPAGDNDFLIYRLRADGKELWWKHLGGTNFDVGRSVRQAADGSFVVAGESMSYSNGGATDVLIYRLNPNGEFFWGGWVNLGGPLYDGANAIALTED